MKVTELMLGDWVRYTTPAYKEKVKPKIKWTLGNSATAARYCKTKTEFRRKYHRAYERLRKEGLLDELFEDKKKQKRGGHS